MLRLRIYLFLSVIVAAVTAFSCTDYGARINELEQRLKALEEECNTLNKNTEGLTTIISALQENDELLSFEPIEENGSVIGFKAVFKNAGEVTVYNQQTSVSVGQYQGKYYWTAGGEWLTDDSGNKIEISTQTPLPQFVVDDGKLKVSVDGGETWQYLGDIDKALISGVRETESQVVFTLSGGAEIVIPKYQPFTLTLDGDDVDLKPGESVDVTYNVSASSESEISVTAVCGDGWTAEVKPATECSGVITVTAPDPITEERITVLAGDGLGRMVAVEMRLWAMVLNPVLEVIRIPREGGSISADVQANVSYEVACDAAWLQYVETKTVRTDNLSFVAEENDGFERSATVTLTAGNYSRTILFYQSGVEPSLLISPQQMSFDCSAVTAELRVTANVEYSYTVSDNWVVLSQISVGKYLVSVEANESETARSATVTFSGENSQSQVLTINQEAYVARLDISPESFSFECDGGYGVITVTSNLDYSISVSDESWIQLSPNGSSGNLYSVNVLENETFDSRTATITFSAQGVDDKVVTVSQTGQEPYLDIMPSSLTFDGAGGTATVSVSSNVAYSVTLSDSSWLTLSGTPATGTVEFNLSAAKNSSSSQRTATVTFASEDLPDETLTVIQSARNDILPYAEGGSNLYVSTGNYHYRYGPSIILNDDGSLDVWTAKEGAKYLDYSDYMYQENGSRSKVSAYGHTIAQYFNTQHRFLRILVSLYGTGGSDAITLRLYKWAGSYSATLATSPIGIYAISGSISSDGNRYSVYETNSNWMPAGEYMWTATEATSGVGVFKFPGAGTISLTDAVSYYDGTAASDYNFQAKLRGSKYNSSNFVDRFAYFHSSDAGANWSAERDVMFPTEGSEDHYSVCDPGAAFFGGWYYMAYTSAPNTYGGTYNHCYVARSRSPQGPWYKWNGSGWGGDPAKVIKFTGSTEQWGAGEPCIVLLDNTIYFYYTWTEGAAESYPTTWLATAPLSENWPGDLTVYGKVIDKSQFECADSCDIKYVEDCGLFYAFHTYNRYRFNSGIAVWTSPDGKNFTYRGDVQGDVLKYVGNMGVSGDGNGHMRLSDPMYISYSYGGNATGNWSTWFSPLYFSE